MSQVIWITGGAGFIGTAVTDKFERAGWTCVTIDRQPGKAARHVLGDVTALTLDRALAVAGRPDLIFHGAGTASVGRANADPTAAVIDTVETARAVFTFISRKSRRTRFITPSSAAVYGNAGDVALTEALPPRPISLYGRLKHEVETLCRRARMDGIAATAIRFFSVYGPGLRKQLPWELGTKLSRGATAVTLFGTGDETRDFLNIDDAAELIFKVGTAEGAPDVLNGGSGTPVNVRAFADSMARAFARQVEFTFNGVTRPDDPTHYRAEISRARALGWEARVGLDQGLSKYSKWIEATQRNIKNQS